MNAQPDEPFDVFLSHAHTEAEVVESIGIKLEDEAGLRVWLDRWVLVPGEHWQQQMAKGLDQAKTCAVCVGSNTPAGWFREEIERAGVRGVPPGRRPMAKANPGAGLVSLKEKLSHIRELRLAGLIDEGVALEFQRRLVDKHVKSER